MATYSLKTVRECLGSFAPLKRLYYSLFFVVRVLRNRLILTPIDRKAPFLGPLANSGIYHRKLSQEVLDTLKRKFHYFAKEDLNVTLDDADSALLRELFDFLTPAVRAYLGPESYLDGMNWFVSVRTGLSISSRWHTDNVGSRLRVFCCIEGDGSQPTQVIASHERIPRVITWLHHSFIEAFRWAGFGLRKIKSHELVSCAHKEGDMYVFDTQLLHRGAYETGHGRRVVLQIDFSNPAKHVIARGPIGTDELNTFQFTEKLLEVPSFREIIDARRVCRLSSGALKYVHQ